jgi:hypothetical protein
MSYQPTIYAKKNNILLSELKLSLEQKAWNFIFCPDNRPVKLKDTGALSNGLIYAWNFDSNSKDLLATHLDNNTYNEIKKKLNDGSLATCGLFINDNYSINDEYEEDEIEELVADMGDEYVANLRKAKCTITSSSNASCGPLSDDFHEIFLDILIEISNGFCEDE